MVAQHPLTEPEILARLLHRDAMMLVLNKPSGIAVHVTGHDAVALDQSFHHLQFGLPKKPELAHRLDRGTSGCLVLGRHRQALIKLGKLFEQQKIVKTYLAILIGTPAEESGVIDRAILKSGVGSKWKMSLDDAGQAAVTEYRVLKSFEVRPYSDAGLPAPPLRGSQISDLGNLVGGNSELNTPHQNPQKGFDSPSRGELQRTLSLVEFRPRTGRTHQIRLHAAFALGCPVVGDPFYAPEAGEFSANNYPMMLHAETVEIPLQQSKPPVMVRAPLPDYWLKID